MIYNIKDERVKKMSEKDYLVIKNGESEMTAESKQKFASDLQKAMAKYKGEAKSINEQAEEVEGNTP